MISRVILLGIFGVMGLRNLYPVEPEPTVLTTGQLMYKAKQGSVSEVCKKKKKQSESVKKLCKRWEEQQNA
jgi:hypothetical protein